MPDLGSPWQAVNQVPHIEDCIEVEGRGFKTGARER
jgi:hypothetical protein